jgi:adenylate cyclase
VERVTELVERTFAFVDLAGFTALTEAHGDVTVVDLVGRFVGLAAQAVHGRGELVKAIGGAVMLSFGDPAKALAATQLLIVWTHNSGGFPMLRAGLHDGSALPRSGDWFGATVNITARVAGRARGGQTLGTARIAESARDQRLGVMGLGSVQLHNIARPIELFEISLLAPVAPPPVDPVCQMAVDRDQAAGRLRHDNEDFWFCSMRCAAAFAACPERYARQCPARRPTSRATVDGYRLS